MVAAFRRDFVLRWIELRDSSTVSADGSPPTRTRIVSACALAVSLGWASERERSEGRGATAGEVPKRMSSATRPWPSMTSSAESAPQRHSPHAPAGAKAWEWRRQRGDIAERQVWPPHEGYSDLGGRTDAERRARELYIDDRLPFLPDGQIGFDCVLPLLAPWFLREHRGSRGSGPHEDAAILGQDGVARGHQDRRRGVAQLPLRITRVSPGLRLAQLLHGFLYATS
jgi:hypothetical protein